MTNTITLKDYHITANYELQQLPVQQTVINTINPHSWVCAEKDSLFKEALLHSDILLPDGVGIVWAARLLSKCSIPKIAGFDFHRMVLETLNNTGGSVFYLGSTIDTLHKIKQRIHKEYPGIRRIGTYSPPYKTSFSKEDNTRMEKIINDFHPDVLFVGLTAPKQEKWIECCKTRLNANLISGIGAVFDFYAETTPRPPHWMISCGMEWLGRLLKEPKRMWKRNFVSTPLFLKDIIKLKIKNAFMKIPGKVLIWAIIALLATSCTSYKKIPYLQHASDTANVPAPTLYDARIQPKDLLSIIVSTQDPEVAAPFNLTVPNKQDFTKSLTTQPVLQDYLVDNGGCVEFPVLGKLRLGGMTKGEAESFIKDKLKTYIKEEPIVTVRMTNYKIAVIGEVARPGSFTVSNEKVNIFEALAMAGDLTIYGKRDNVKLLREKSNGEKDIVPIDLTDTGIIHSPYYYLQQNDILYVEPNKAKAKNSDIGSSTSIWISSISIIVSVASLLVNVLR